jgi:hypothetical protein
MGLSEPQVRRGGLVFTAVAVVLCVGLYLATPQLITNYRAEAAFFESPGFFPRLALGVAIFAGIWHLGENWFRHVREAGAEEIEIGESRPVIAFVGMALFAGLILLVPYLGYAASSALFVVMASRIAGLGWGVAMGLSATTSAVLYAIFVIGLKVWFPVPQVVLWLGG